MRYQIAFKFACAAEAALPAASQASTSQTGLKHQSVRLRLTGSPDVGLAAVTHRVRARVTLSTWVQPDPRSSLSFSPEAVPDVASDSLTRHATPIALLFRSNIRC